MESKREYLDSARGDEEKGNKAAKGSWFVNLTTNKVDRMDKARGFYEKSANSYKLAEEWEKAGQMYERWAEWDQHSYGSPSLYMIDAVSCYK